MIKALRNNYTLQAILFIIVPLLLWIESFISPAKIPDSGDLCPLYSIIHTIFSGYPFVAAVVAFVLVLLQGVLFNYIISSNSLSSKASFLPAVLFVIFFSFDPQLHTISPILFTNFLLLIIFYHLFKAYDSTSVLNSFFSISCCIALSILIYTPTWILLFLIPLVIIIFRLRPWRIFTISIFGFLAPFIPLVFYYWYIDLLPEQWSLWCEKISFWSVNPPNIDTASIILGIATILLFIILTIVAIRGSREGVISFRRKSLFFQLSSFLLLLISFHNSLLPLNLSFIAIFLAFGFTQSLYRKWRPIFHQLLLLLLLAIMIANCFFIKHEEQESPQQQNFVLLQ